MEKGRGEKFRQPSALERLGRGVGALLPPVLRRRLSGVFSRAIEQVQGDALVATLPHGERVRLLPAHRYMSWNPLEYEAFRADIRPGDTVLDIGANIGAYTVLFAQWVGPTGRVVALEPAPATFAALSQGVTLNGLASRAQLLQQAAASSVGHATFTAVAAEGDNRLTKRTDVPSVTVETVTIDVLCRRLGLKPRLLKVDVEGAELEVLRGARQTIASLGSELRLYVEMHPGLWPEFGITRRDIEAELARQDLRAERIDGGADPWSLEGVSLRLVKCGS